MLKQYFEVKRQYPDAILLFRVGDFYEAYADEERTQAVRDGWSALPCA